MSAMTDTELVAHLRELTEKLTSEDIEKIRTWAQKMSGFDVARMVQTLVDEYAALPALLVLLDSGRQELSAIDQILARRPILDKFEYRYQKIEYAISTAKRVDEAEARAARAEQATKEAEKDLEVAPDAARGQTRNRAL